jgi:hypothetical protein
MIQQMVVSLLDFAWKMVPGAHRPAQRDPTAGGWMQHAALRCAQPARVATRMVATRLRRSSAGPDGPQRGCFAQPLPGGLATRHAVLQCVVPYRNSLSCAATRHTAVATGQDFSLPHTNLPTPNGGLMIVGFQVAGTWPAVYYRALPGAVPMPPLPYPTILCSTGGAFPLRTVLFWLRWV